MKRKIAYLLFITILSTFTFAGCKTAQSEDTVILSEDEDEKEALNTDSEEREEIQIGEYTATEMTLMNGTRTERIGKYLLVNIFSEDCTEDFLLELYNCVKDADYNYAIINFVDQDHLGGYILPGTFIEVNCEILQDDGYYKLGETYDDSIFYAVENNEIIEVDLN